MTIKFTLRYYSTELYGSPSSDSFIKYCAFEELFLKSNYILFYPSITVDNFAT